MTVVSTGLTGVNGGLAAGADLPAVSVTLAGVISAADLTGVTDTVDLTGVTGAVDLAGIAVTIGLVGVLGPG